MLANGPGSTHGRRQMHSTESIAHLSSIPHYKSNPSYPHRTQRPPAQCSVGWGPSFCIFANVCMCWKPTTAFSSKPVQPILLPPDPWSSKILNTKNKAKNMPAKHSCHCSESRPTITENRGNWNLISAQDGKQLWWEWNQIHLKLGFKITFLVFMLQHYVARFLFLGVSKAGLCKYPKKQSANSEKWRCWRKEICGTHLQEGLHGQVSNPLREGK